MNTDDVLKSTGWCAPSEIIFGDFAMPTYPADCGGPHKWEKFKVRDSQCDCGLCGSGEAYRHWLECADCIVVWDEGSEEFDTAWQAAPWG